MLTKNQSNALRGIAILGIMLHNYCHWLGGIVKENEYTFSLDKPLGLLSSALHPSWNLLLDVFSFFGHYGVPVFLFISGYGLVMKYEKNAERHAPMAGGGGAAGQSPQYAGRRKEASWFAFTWYHYLKLLRLMALGYIVYIAYCHFSGSERVFSLPAIMAQFTMVINFIIGKKFDIQPGVYWFFGLMLQLYFIWRIALYKRKSWVGVALVAVCLVVQCLFLDESERSVSWLNRLRYNFVGELLPFVLGVLYARHCKELSRKGLLLVLLLSLVLIVLGSFNVVAWLFVPVFVCSFSVALVKLLPSWAMERCVFVGSLSAAIFVVHPIMREMIIRMSWQGHVFTGLIAYVGATFGYAFLFRWLLSFVPKPKLR